MNKTDRRLLVTGIFGIELLAVSLYGRFTESEILLDSLKTPIADENPYENRDIHNPDKLAPVYVAFAEQYTPELVQASQEYHVPVEMIVGAIIEENAMRPVLDDWKDLLLQAWNASTPWRADPSLGIGQVNVSTAQYLASKYEQQTKDYETIKDELLTAEGSIEYVAMTLADLLHRENRKTEGHIFDDPHLVTIIGTEYVRGPTSSPLTVAQATSAGTFYTWCVSNVPAIRLFGEHAQITPEQQDALRAYAKTATYVE